MKAAQIKNYGHADTIRVASAPKPKAGTGQVVLEVHASSINPIDALIREGKFPGAELPMILGVDVAGIIDSVGEGASTFKGGDRVFGQASAVGGGSGAFAEFAIAPESMLGKMPQRASYTEAASVALTGVSALQALTEHINLTAGQKLLIQGGAGGIGSIAVQFAKYLGAHVATTVSGADVDFAKELGADLVIDYQTQKFEDVVRDFDAVFDTVGGETAHRSYAALKRGGVLVSMIASVDEPMRQQYGVNAMMQSTKVTTDKLNALSKLIDDGVITVHVEKTYPLAEVSEAFNQKESGHVRGKIAIEVRKA
jgi:alcohol dehydrogenase